MKVVMTIDLPVSLEKLIGKEIGANFFYPDNREYIMTEYVTMRKMPKKYIGDLKDYEVGWNDALEEIENDL